RIRDEIENAELRAVATRHARSARRAADRRRRERVRESRALARETVQVRRVRLRVTGAAERPCRLIVAVEKHDAGPAPGGGASIRRRRLHHAREALQGDPRGNRGRCPQETAATSRSRPGRRRFLFHWIAGGQNWVVMLNR